MKIESKTNFATIITPTCISAMHGRAKTKNLNKKV